MRNSKDEESLDFDKLNSIVILKSPEKENTPIKVEGHTVSVIQNQTIHEVSIEDTWMDIIKEISKSESKVKMCLFK